MRVIMSPIGSVIAMVRSPSPARLHETGDQALGAEVPHRDAAHLELAVIGARAAGHLATIADPGRRAVARQRRELDGSLEALLERPRPVVGDRLEPRPLARVLLGQLA